MSATTRDRQEQALQRLERFSDWSDNNFRVPFTRFRIGFGPLIALIPGIGDVLDLVMSLWVVNEARRVGASRALIGRMLGHLAIDFVGGLLPIVGDLFDAFYKANSRNTDLLRHHLHGELGRPRATELSARTVILSLLLASIVLTTLIALL